MTKYSGNRKEILFRYFTKEETQMAYKLRHAQYLSGRGKFSEIAPYTKKTNKTLKIDNSMCLWPFVLTGTQLCWWEYKWTQKLLKKLWHCLIRMSRGIFHNTGIPLPALYLRHSSSCSTWETRENTLEINKDIYMQIPAMCFKDWLMQLCGVHESKIWCGKGKGSRTEIEKIVAFQIQRQLAAETEAVLQKKS